MGLIIDAREAFHPQRTGKGIYTYSLIMALAEVIPEAKVTLLGNQKPKVKLPKAWSYQRIIGTGLVWQLRAALYCRRHKKSVLLSPTSYLLPWLVSNKSLVVVHDLITFLFAKGHNHKATIIERFCLPRLINKVELLTVSQSTKEDLQKLFPHASPQKINVASAALSKAFKKKVGGKIKQNWLLTVGTLIPRKNLSVLIQAFNILLKKHKEFRNHQLHVVGAKGWETSELAKTIKQSKFKKNLKIHGYIANQDLAKLYKQANVFVMPSLYEGFGLPLLEAMASNCAIISSDRSSLPEVAGDAALYFDPQSPEDLATKLHYLLKNKELQSILRTEGEKQLQKFSWEKSAQLVKQKYEKLLK